MSGQTILDPKYAGETKTIRFDFTSDISLGETLSTPSVTATVYSGTDGSPSSVIFGSATASGAIISQSITGGVVGVIYELLCTTLTSANQTLKKSAYLAVVPDLL